jgi:hypothetical protein
MVLPEREGTINGSLWILPVTNAKGVCGIHLGGLVADAATLPIDAVRASAKNMLQTALRLVHSRAAETMPGYIGATSQCPKVS